MRIPGIHRLTGLSGKKSILVAGMAIVAVGVIGSSYLLFASHADTTSGGDRSQALSIVALQKTRAQIVALDEGVRYNAAQNMSAKDGNRKAAINGVAAGSAVKAQLNKAASGRVALLDTLMQTQPQEAAKLLLPDRVLTDLSGASGSDLEKKVTLQGTLEILHKDAAPKSEAPDTDDYRIVDSEGIVTHLYTNGTFSNIAPGSRVSVIAYQANRSALVLASAATGSTDNNMAVLAAAPAASPAVVNTAVLIANFNGGKIRTYTPETNQAMFTGADGLESWYSDESYGKAELNPTFFGAYVLPETLSNGDCPNSYDSYQQAQELAAAANSDVLASHPDGWSHYQRIVYQLNCYNSQHGGYAYIGPSVFTIPGTGAQIQIGQSFDFANGGPSFTKVTIAHELSHNLGNLHANAYNCLTKSFVPMYNFDAQNQGCDSTQYGNPFDVLGGENEAIPSLDALHKQKAGWLSAANFPTLNTVGTRTYKILPYETATDGILALNIPRSSGGTSLTVEYRQPIGRDANVVNAGNAAQGPLINYNALVGGYGGGGDTQLLDMDPTNNQNFLNSALLPGKTFTDPQTGIAITTVSADTTGATVSVRIPRTALCVHTPMTAALISSDTSSAAYPAPLTYTYHVTNNDTTACTAQEFRYQGGIFHGQNTGSGPDADFSTSIATPSFTLAPGASADVTLSLAPSPTMTAGSYQLYDIGTFMAHDPDSSQVLGKGGYDSPLYPTVTAPTDTRAPTAPTKPVVTVLGATIANLSWTAARDNKAVAGYTIVVNGLYAYKSTEPKLMLQWLDSGTTNTVTIAAFDRQGNVSPTTPVTITTPLPPSTGPTLPTLPGRITTAIADTSATINWSPSYDSAGIAGYQVYGYGVGSYYTVLDDVVGAINPSVTLTGLSPNTAYAFYVTAISTSSGYSQTKMITFTTAQAGSQTPTQPQQLYTVTGAPSAVNLKWQPSTAANSIAGYYVFRAYSNSQYRNGTYLYLGTAKTTTFKDTHTVAGQVSYYVQAFDAIGNVSPPSDSFTIEQTTYAPGGTTPPTMVRVTKPLNNAAVAGMVDLTAVSSLPDSGGSPLASGVTYYIDSQPLTQYSLATSPYAFSWDSRTVANGPHTLFATATDQYGQFKASAVLTIIVAN